MLLLDVKFSPQRILTLIAIQTYVVRLLLLNDTHLDLLIRLFKKRKRWLL